MDVIIVGGGVIGASIAYYLSEAGARVTLLERGRAGGHASLAAAGLLHPLHRAHVPAPLHALSAASIALYPDLTERLRALTGIDPQYQAVGWLRVALHTDEVRPLQKNEIDDVQGGDYGLQLLSGDEARALEPALSPAVAAAVHVPRGAQVYAPALLQGYTHAAARLGAMIRRGVEVTSLCTEGRRVTGVRTGDGVEILAEHTVIAGGAWSSRLTAPLGAELPVYPIRGQILALHAIPAPLRRVIFGGDVYLAPKVDGSIVVGATYEDVGFDDRLTAAGLAGLLASAAEVVPALGDATYRQAWGGLRPGSRDGLPLIGPLPGWDGATVAAGHIADGIMLSPITGKLVAQHLQGLTTDLPLEPFDPAR